MITDVLVIGGGVIGLSAAWQLAAAGLGVRVIERHHVGWGASAAAAGMLAPLAEAHRPGDFVSLGLRSLQLYGPFLDALNEAAHRRVALSANGMCRVALDEAEAAELEEAARWQSRFGLRLEILDARDAREIEPAFGDQVRLAVHSPEERQIDPRELLDALRTACSRLGVTIDEGTAIESAMASGNSIATVITTAGRLDVGHVVLAAGAWSGRVARLLDLYIPVRPIRGQIVAAEVERPLRHAVYSRRGYFVPRGDRVLIGSTEEDVGFDCSTTEEGISRLSGSARVVVPNLGGMNTAEAWAGLRPATVDGLPVIGRSSHWDNVIVATGHYRNGILLAPVTAEIVRELVARRIAAVPESLSPDRFAASEASV